MSKRKHDESEKLSKTDKDELNDRDKADKSKRSKNSTRDSSDKPSGASLKSDKKTSGESKSKRDAQKDEKKEKVKRSIDTNDEDAGNSATASGGEVSLSIEETNKLRAKLGLKPLQVDSGPSKPAKSEASGGSGKPNKVAERMVTNEVFVRAENAADKQRTENIKLKLDTRKEARKIERRLARIKTLGESSDEDADDIADWVTRQRTLDDERKLAEQRAKMFEDLDNELEDRAPVPPAVTRKEQPSASGLKVDHAFDQIEPGMQITLTLKDAPVLAGTSKRGRDDYDTALLGSASQVDGDEDVLVSVDLLEHERGERSRTNQSQLAAWKRGLASLDDDANGQASLLSKYDAPKTASFRIGQPPPEVDAPAASGAALPLPTRRFDDAPKISIELPELRVARDFLTEDEMAARFKKRRPTKSAKTNLRRNDPAPEGSGNRVTRRETVADQPTLNIEVDEEVAIRGELESLLERTRQAKLREFKAKEESAAPDFSMASALRRLRPITEFINLQPSNVSENDETEQQESAEETGATGLDFNATFEFCKKVAAKQEEMARRRAQLEKEAGIVLPRVDDDEMQIASDDEQRDIKPQPADDSDMDVDVKPKERSTTTKLKFSKRDSEDDDTKHKVPKREIEHDDSAADSDSDSSSRDGKKDTKTAVLEEEPVLNSGVCAAIQVALKKGYLDTRTEQKAVGSRLTNLQAKQYQVEQKRYDDIDAKFAKRDRFASSAIQTFREKEGYNPNVKLQYVDESGKKLDAKAEFQRLSWRFHGKTSGKNKLEKRAALEKRAHALKVMDASDTPLGTAEKLRRKLEHEQQPFLVLSGAASASSSKT